MLTLALVARQVNELGMIGDGDLNTRRPWIQCLNLLLNSSSVRPSVGPKGGINATRLALGDAPDVAAPADIVGGVTEPPAPVKAASTPLMAAMADPNT